MGTGPWVLDTATGPFRLGEKNPLTITLSILIALGRWEFLQHSYLLIATCRFIPGWP